MGFSESLRRAFISPMVAPFANLSTKKAEYKRARDGALLCVRCKNGKLIIAAESFWVEPASLNNAPSPKDVAIPRKMTTGIQTSRGAGLSSNLVIRALGARELHADWMNLKDVERVVALLGNPPDESQPRGTMQEMVEYYLSLGFVLVSRDEQGAQLTRNLSTNFGGLSAPVPFVRGVQVSSGAIHQSQAVVYVRADGSVIERVSSS